MLDLISKSEVVPDKLFNQSVKLDSFAVNIRYPDIIIMPTKEEIQEAIDIAETCKKFVMDIILKYT